MFTVLIVFHVLMAAALIALVLLQRGPGATMGAAFGSGASGTVFGSRGAGSFLTRATAVLAVGFFSISLTMAVLAARAGGVGEQDDLGVAATEVQESTEEAAQETDEEDEFLVVPEDDSEDDGVEEEEEDPDPDPEPPVD